MKHCYANMVFLPDGPVLYSVKSLKDADFQRRMYAEANMKCLTLVSTDPADFRSQLLREFCVDFKEDV